MALKGTAVIELTNVKTGEKERYVEHNLITKALEYIHQPIGNLKSPTSVTTDGYEPAYISLLGGLVLWDSTIAENSEIITQPHGVKAVGCACYKQVNATTSERRGSYNETESYLTTSSTEKSMKFVYDFTTSQANGTIKCISLTNWKEGWNGFGGNNDANDFQGTRNSYDYYMGHDGSTSYWFNSTLASPGNLFLIDPDQDVFYQLSSVTVSTVKISKYRANLHEKSMFTSIVHTHELVESISVTLPTTLSGASNYVYNYDPKTDLLYIVVGPSGNSVASSGAFYVITINMTSHAASVYEMTNPLSTTLYIDSRYIVCRGEHLYYIYNGTAYVRKIALADSSLTSKYLTGVWYPYMGHTIFLVGDMIYFQAYRTISSSKYYALLAYDPDANTFEITGNGYSGANSSDCGMPYRLTNYNRHPTPIKGHPLHYYYFYTYSTDTTWTSTAYIWLNTKYLATINNLSLPIEKTSDKTMKITYTIQEV